MTKHTIPFLLIMLLSFDACSSDHTKTLGECTISTSQYEYMGDGQYRENSDFHEGYKKIAFGVEIPKGEVMEKLTRGRFDISESTFFTFMDWGKSTALVLRSKNSKVGVMFFGLSAEELFESIDCLKPYGVTVEKLSEAIESYKK